MTTQNQDLMIKRRDSIIRFGYVGAPAEALISITSKNYESTWITRADAQSMVEHLTAVFKLGE